VSAWTSAGRLAIDTLAGTPHTIALLPSVPWLGLAATLGAALAVWTCSRGVPAGLYLLPVVALVAWTTLAPWPAIVAWAGPAVLIPFALLLCGIIGKRISAWQMPARWSPCVAAILTALCLSAIVTVSDGLLVTGDEPHYLLTTQSLLSDGDLDLANNYDNRTYRSFYSGALEPRHVATGVLGEQFTFHGLAVSVLVLPGFAAFGALGARLTIVLFAAIGAGFFWSAAHRLTRSTATAWVAWGAMVSSAPFAFHSVTIYPDGIGASVTSIALWALVTLVADMTISVAASVGVGVALAILPWLHIRLSSAAGLLGLVILLAMLRRTRDLILPFLAAPAISFVLWIASTWVMFGTMDPTAIFRQKAGGSLAAMPTGTLGLLFDAEYGLLVYAPIMAIATLGILAMFRRSALVGFASTVLTVTTLGIGGAWIWWGGDSAPARFLAPVLPLLCLMLAAWWTTAPVGARAFAGATIVAGACLTIAMAIADSGRYIVNFPDGQGTAFDWLSPNVDLTLALPSLFRTGAVPGTEALIALSWTLVGAMAFAATLLTTRRRTIGGGTTWLIASIAVLVWMTSGAVAGWGWHGVVPWTPDRGQLRLLHAAPSPTLALGLVGPSPQFVSRDTALSASKIAMPLMDTSTVLHVPFVPAGRYAIEVASTTAAPTPILTLELGRNAWPFLEWSPQPGAGAVTFSLATAMYLVRVVADQAVKTSLPAVRLQPMSVVASASSADVALRATRYGTLVVYSLDSYSYPEPDGFWMAADRTGRVLVTDADARPISHLMTFEAGDAAAVVHVTRAAFSTMVTLAPHARERLVIADADQAAPVQFTVSGGSTLPAGDGRRLGVFVRVAVP
jgi:hypothetical protein